MSANDTMNHKEQVMNFFYVLILFLMITVACCSLLFLYNSKFNSFKQKDFVVLKMERIREYQKKQKQMMEIINLLHDKISSYDPKVNAVYEVENIKFMVNELKTVYDNNSLDSRYKSFQHIGNFYYMWYADKKTLWSIQENIGQFTRNLEECELGLANKKDDFAKLKR
ncbi:MAG: type VI secretion system transmembrane protein TssO [Tannerella sp.]|jgi:hypothetical protein|nr:type VI secretion system transmembrane protein TssO [Tannerella sp.]